MLHIKLKCSTVQCLEVKTKLGVSLEDDIANIINFKTYLTGAATVSPNLIGYRASRFGMIAADKDLERIHRSLHHPYLIRDLSYYYHKTGSHQIVKVGGTFVGGDAAAIVGIPAQHGHNSNFFMFFSRYTFEDTFKGMRGKYVHSTISYL